MNKKIMGLNELSPIGNHKFAFVGMRTEKRRWWLEIHRCTAPSTNPW
jgi:hypothetical protein